MSAVRKIVVSSATMFLGLSAMFLAVGVASADNYGSTLACENDWHQHCP